jgi:CopG family transcriptional regulator / antitoxin EndoAI
MHRRINITLPEKTVQLIDRLAQKGDRSRLINEAIVRYIEEVGRRNLRKQIKEGVIKRAERDLEIVTEYFPLEEEAWQQSQK